MFWKQILFFFNLAFVKYYLKICRSKIKCKFGCFNINFNVIGLITNANKVTILLGFFSWDPLLLWHLSSLASLPKCL